MFVVSAWTKPKVRNFWGNGRPANMPSIIRNPFSPYRLSLVITIVLMCFDFRVVTTAGEPIVTGEKPFEVCNEELDGCFQLYLGKNVTWWEASNICRQINSQLLPCYKENEIIYLLDLIDDFYHRDNFHIWLKTRSCHQTNFIGAYNPKTNVTNCVSLAIMGLGSTHRNSYFLVIPCHNTSLFICKSSIKDDAWKQHYCPATEFRGIQWPRTQSDRMVQIPCPPGKTGKAKWTCLRGHWFPERPDLSNCVTKAIGEASEKINEENFGTALSDLQRATQPEQHGVKGLVGGDIKTAITAINEIRKHATSQAKEKQIPANQMINFSDGMLQCVDNLLKAKEAWLDFARAQKANEVTRLFETVDNIGQYMAYGKDVSDYAVSKDTLAFQTTKVQQNKPLNFPILIKSNQTTLDVWSKYKNNANMTFPSGVRPKDSETDNRIAFSIFNDMRDIFLPPSNYTLLQGHHYKKWGNRTLNSAVVSATFITKGPNEFQQERLKDQEVRIKLRHLIPGVIMDTPVCVFWNVENKQWDSQGCRLYKSERTYTVCECDHLTNFAVLMDIYGDLQEIPEIHKSLLNVITIVGCVISIACLAFTSVVYISYRVLRNLKGAIHCNLCITLMLGEIVLIAAVDSTQNKVACAVVAGLLHYLFLSTFAWMLLEGVHIYILCVTVFQLKRSYHEYFFGIGYGLPFVIVAISAAIRYEDYGTDQHCWLSNERGLIWSFVGPVIVILLANISILVIALRKTERLALRKIQDDKEKIRRIKNWIRNTLVLSPTLGLNWCLGFIYFTRATLVWAYVFTVLNSLQGLFIFLLYCIMEERARALITRTIRRHSPIVSLRESISTRSSKLQRSSATTSKGTVSHTPSDQTGASNNRLQAELPNVTNL